MSLNIWILSFIILVLTRKRFVIRCRNKPCHAVMFTPGLSETVGATSHQQYSIKDRCWNYWLYEAAYPKCQRLNIAWLQQLDVNRNTCSGFCGHTGMSKCTVDLQALVEMKILSWQKPSYSCAIWGFITVFKGTRFDRIMIYFSIVQPAVRGPILSGPPVTLLY
jgi:hypothetical protein